MPTYYCKHGRAGYISCEDCHAEEIASLRAALDECRARVDTMLRVNDEMEHERARLAKALEEVERERAAQIEAFLERMLRSTVELDEASAMRAYIDGALESLREMRSGA